MDHMNHMPFLQRVADEDVACIRLKEQTYKGSWRRGGGVNAWHMARRKIDRLQTMLAPTTVADAQRLREIADHLRSQGCYAPTPNVGGVRAKEDADLLMRFVEGEDIFAAMDADTTGADGTVLAEVRDLRRYLTLFEARLLANAQVNDSAYDDRLDATVYGIDTARQGAKDITVVTYSSEVQRVSDETGVPEYAVAYAIKMRNESNVTVSNYMVAGHTAHYTIVDPADDKTTYQFTAEGALRVLDAYAAATERLVPRAVPAEDSSRHAEREDISAWTQESIDARAGQRAEGGWMIKPVITAELHRMLSQNLAARYVVTGRHAVADRAQYNEQDREAKFNRLPLVKTADNYRGSPEWMRELYAPSNVVENEYYLLNKYREHWGHIRA